MGPLVSQSLLAILLAPLTIEVMDWALGSKAHYGVGAVAALPFEAILIPLAAGMLWSDACDSDFCHRGHGGRSSPAWLLAILGVMARAHQELIIKPTACGGLAFRPPPIVGALLIPRAAEK
jgi:hypothetical protein